MRLFTGPRLPLCRRLNQLRDFCNHAVVFRSKWVLLLLLLGLTLGDPKLTLGQNAAPPAPGRNDIIPPAPTAAALGKFADIPVGLYTGKPQVTIPLWTATAGKLTLPVSLDYNAGGIKVEDIASWVGLGWSLNAGGVITRSVRGAPDEGVPGAYGSWGLYSSYYTLRAGGGYNPATDNSAFVGFATGKADSQPDLYYFNFGGKSGKFVTLNQNGDVQLTPYQNLQVRPVAGGWQVTAEDGTRYQFQHPEYSTYATSTTSLSSAGSSTSSSEPQRYVSSWFLSRIISTTSDTIRFFYSDYSLLTYPIASSESKYAWLDREPNRVTTLGDSYSNNAMTLSQGKRLRRIEFANGALDFIPGVGRRDVVGDSVLAQVVVRQRRAGAAVVKTFTLQQQYLQGTSLVPLAPAASPPTTEAIAAALGYRLMLTAVSERNGNVSKPPYRLEYVLNNPEAGNGMPYRAPAPEQVGNVYAQGYYAQDHWGYYNGQDNTTLVPPVTVYDASGQPQKLPGANRSPELAFARIGSLVNITYPTGGSTSFDWELHDFQPPASLVLTPVTRNRAWSFFTYPVGTTPTPFVVNDEVAHSAEVAIRIDGRFPCSCLGDRSYYDVCQGMCYVWFKVINDDTHATFFTFNGNTSNRGGGPPTYTVTLPNGHYHVEHHHEIRSVYSADRYEYTPDPNMPYGLSLTWQETVSTPFNQGGGLRIAKMTDMDPVAQQRTVKTYEYRQADGRSSGNLTTYPKYTYNMSEGISQKANSWDPDSYQYTNHFTVRTSNSQSSLGTTQGSMVGYSLVTVYQQVNGGTGSSNGKTEHYYTASDTYSDNSSGMLELGYPFAPTDSRDWQRGLLTRQIDYRAAGTAYLPVRRLDNSYRFYTAADTSNPNVRGRSVVGLKVGLPYRFCYVVVSSNYYQFAQSSNDPIAYQYFTTSSGYAELAKTTTTLYNPTTATQTNQSETTYSYNAKHLQIVDQRQRLSNGDSLRTTFRYPDDFSVGASGNSAEVAALRQLQDTHQANELVERQQWVRPSGAAAWQLSAGTLLKFKSVAAAPGAGSAALVLPAERHLLEVSTPISGAQAATVMSGSLVADAHYHKRETLDKYTEKGRLLQSATVPRQTTVYLWGYAQQYPIAEIKNASYTEVAAILGPTVIAQLAQANPGSDAAVQQALQPLRAQLKQAQVITYTYNPLLGMTSQTDPTGRTTTYEYDGLGRLMRTRDEQGRILSQQQYHYAGK